MNTHASSGKVNYSGLPESGIELRAPSRAKKADVSSPLDVEVTNRTKHRIVALKFTVRALDRDGALVHERDVTFLIRGIGLHSADPDAWSDYPAVAAGASQLIQIDDQKRFAAQGSEDLTAVPKDDVFTEATAISIALQSVMFENGTVVGPGKSDLARVVTAVVEGRRLALEAFLAGIDANRSPADIEEEFEKEIQNQPDRTDELVLRSESELRLLLSLYKSRDEGVRVQFVENLRAELSRPWFAVERLQTS